LGGGLETQRKLKALWLRSAVDVFRPRRKIRELDGELREKDVPLRAETSIERKGQERYRKGKGALS